MKRLLLATLVLGCWSSSASAQTCLGAMTFEQAPMRAGANIAFSSETLVMSAGIARGFTNFFAGGGFVRQTISGYDDSSAKGFFFSGGTERTMGPGGKYFVCPLVSIFKTWGLDTFVDGSNSQILATFGGMVGWEAMTSGNRRIVPFGGATIDYLRNAAEAPANAGPFAFGFTDSSTFLSLQGGVGLIMNDRMVFTPAISIPVGSEFDLTPRITVAFTTKIGS